MTTTNVCVFCFAPLHPHHHGPRYCTKACADRDRVWDQHIERTRAQLARGENVHKIEAMPGFGKTALVINRFVQQGGPITSAPKSPAPRRVPVAITHIKEHADMAATRTRKSTPKAEAKGPRYIVDEVVGLDGIDRLFVVRDTNTTAAVFVTLHKVKAGKRASYLNEQKVAA